MNVVPAGILHTAPMAEILNEIIERGGTTAMIDPVSKDTIAEWMARGGPRAAWHVAEDESGHVLGFQWIEPADYLPRDAAEIATFARIGHVGQGIGSALFNATEKAARRLGYTWINANIRADNAGGLAYYQSRGFEDYGTMPGVVLANGQTVDKVLKRFDL